MSSIIVDEEDSEEAAAAESSKPRMSIPDKPSSSCSSILAAPERDRRMIASSLIIDLQAHHHDHVHSPDPNLPLPPSLLPPAAVSDLPLREDSCLSIHGHNPRRSRSRGVTTSWRPPVACSSCSRSRSYDVAAACMQPPPPPRPLVQWSSLPSVAAIASCNSAAAARSSSFLWDHDQHSAPRPIPRAAVPTQVISVTPFPSLSVSTATRLSALFHSLQGSSSSSSSGGSSSSSSSSSSTPQYSSSSPLQLSSQSAFSYMTSMSSSEATVLMRPCSRPSSHTAKKLATCRHQILQAAATASSSRDQTSAVPTLAEPRAAENNILEEDCFKQQAVQQQHGPTLLQEEDEEESEHYRDDGRELEGGGGEAVENSFHPSEFGDLIAESPTPGATSMRAVGQTLDPGSSIPIAAASPGAENNAAEAAAGVLAHDDDDDVIFAAAAANCRRRSCCCHGFLQSQIPAPCESPESTSSWLRQQRTLHCVLETTTSGPMSAAEPLNLHSSSSSSSAAAAAADIVVSSSSSVSEFCSSQIIQGSLDQQEHVQQSHGSATQELDKQLVINVAATSDDNNNNKTFPHSSQQQQQQQQSLAGRVKGQWGCAEDRIVSKLVKRYGTRRWSLISTFLASESVSFCIILLTAMLSLSSSSSPSSSSSSSSSSVSLVFFSPLVFGFEFLHGKFLCVCVSLKGS